VILCLSVIPGKPSFLGEKLAAQRLR